MWHGRSPEMPTYTTSERCSWRKAQSSIGNGACIEVTWLNGMVAVRNSRDPGGPVLMYTAAEWRAFVDGVKKGEFDDLC
jgi:hypothetical protein